VDNLTHAFVGAAMADCAVPRDTVSRTRVAMMAAGIVAANAPDIDLFYTSITEEPLGYLLHHRGHSHTLPALAALGLLIWWCLRLMPSLRSEVRGRWLRYVGLIAAALASHLLMDTANGYGTHLFYPLSSAWVYGDAVFVLEPWLWAILGTTAALNAGRRARVLLAFVTLLLIGVLGGLGILHRGVLAVMLGVMGAAATRMWTWDRRRRATIALMTAAAIFLTMPIVSRIAKEAARQTLASGGDGRVVDIVGDPNPGVPWCWGVLTLQQGSAGDAAAMVARRGTLSLLPSVWPAESCASARLSARRSGHLAASPAIVWHRRWEIDRGALGALATGNCRVRAWLQFGRVPYVANGRIADLRFENPIGQNFTPMAIGEAAGACPPYLTDWEWPRRDVLADPSDTSTE
jgi:inner membrane protein